jgi:hypothetical protein
MPIMSKQRDLLLYCPQCGTLHVRDGGVNVVDYEIADFSKSAPIQGRTYVPFWRLNANYVIKNIDSSGGTVRKLSEWMKGGAQQGGDIFIFVPAPDFDPPTFKRFAIMFTSNWPKYAVRADFGGFPRLPAVMPKEEASQLANFVVITLEAEKSGVLQFIDYSLEVKDSRIIYLPFTSGAQGLVPAL